MRIIELNIVLLVIALGFVFFINKAWKERKDSYRLKSFFLGGAQLGPTLTEHNSIGMTFAWAGGIWFFVTLAFAYGPWVILLQIFWSLSIIFFGLLFSPIHAATKNRTIHGFLEACYNKNVRKIACIATALGYIFNTGFELYWSGKMFSGVFDLRLTELSLPIGIVLSLFAAVYCNIGGYRANASTDKGQNILGVIALGCLAVFTALASQSQALLWSSIIFCAGGTAYIILSLNSPKSITESFSKKISIFSFFLAGVAYLISLVLSFSSQTTAIDTNVLKSSSPSYIFLIGLILFQLFYNVVDMANWQSVAANGDIPKEEHKKLSWSIIRSALYLNWFPALGGTIVGLALRASINVSTITDDNIFHHAFATVMPGSGEFIRGLILGIMLLGFLSATLSTADSYLMSATQTLIYDFFIHDKVQSLLKNEDIEGERKIVVLAKAMLYPIAIAMVIVFWFSYTKYRAIEGNALDFQMIMYAFALTLFSPVLYGLFGNKELIPKLQRTAFWSIAIGLLTAIFPYIYAVAKHVPAETRNILVWLTPVYSLISSSLVFFIGKSFIKKT